MLKKINILGQDYTLIADTPANNPKLENANGYIEPYSKKIVVDSTLPDRHLVDKSDAENLEVHLRHVYRHEILHAFFEESGISYQFESEDEDFIVDWFAKQFPKIRKIFDDLGVSE